jgi:hypothetical protein
VLAIKVALLALVVVALIATLRARKRSEVVDAAERKLDV